MAYAAYVFDAYGTLFDVHSAVRRHADAVGPDGQLLSEIWRAKQLEYSWTRALMGQWRDFWALTEEALDHAFERVPSADKGLRPQLLEAYFKLDCYPEVPAVLKALKAMPPSRLGGTPVTFSLLSASTNTEPFHSFLDSNRRMLSVSRSMR